MKAKKLSTKIALITCSVMAAVFLVLISVTVTKTANSIESASFEELQMRSAKNAGDIQQVMEVAQFVADNLSNYLKDYSSQKSLIKQQLIYQPDSKDPKYTSKIYPAISLDADTMTLENFLVATVRVQFPVKMELWVAASCLNHMLSVRTWKALLCMPHRMEM